MADPHRYRVGSSVPHSDPDADWLPGANGDLGRHHVDLERDVSRDRGVEMKLHGLRPVHEHAPARRVLDGLLHNRFP